MDRSRKSLPGAGEIGKKVGAVLAHAFLRMLAYYLEWHLRWDLAPLLYAEEDPAVRQATCNTVVSPGSLPRPIDQVGFGQRLTFSGRPV